jgi:hypothetical protein
MSIRSSFNKSRLAVIAVLAVMSAAPPALAQSFGYPGSQMPNYFESNGARTWGSWSAPQSVEPGRGLYAFAGHNRGLSGFASVRHPHRGANKSSAK